jgi:hypothetical protein
MNKTKIIVSPPLVPSSNSTFVPVKTKLMQDIRQLRGIAMILTNPKKGLSPATSPGI